MSMHPPVNLRSDLAQLDEAELATRLDEAWQAYEAAKQRFPASFWIGGSPPERGPVRHPRAYRFAAVLMSNPPWSWLDLVFAFLFSGKATEGALRSDRATDMYLSLCEVKDITDEIERRVARRKHANPE